MVIKMVTLNQCGAIWDKITIVAAILLVLKKEIV